MATGAAIGAGAQLLGGAVGGKAAKKAASKAAEAEARSQQQMLARLDNIKDPELRQVIAQDPTLVGLLDAENLGDSAMEDISVDPRMRESQMQALAALSEQGQSGFNAEDRAQLGQLQRSEDARAQADQKSIESQMAQRGNMDSGMALAMKLAAQQGSAQRGMESAENLAAQASAAKRNALMQAGQMAGNMGQQDFSQQAQQAQARDVIDRFNTSNRQATAASNLAARQSIADQKRATDIQNQQNYNQYEQAKFDNAMGKASGQNQITKAQGQSQANAANQAGQGAANMWSGLGNAVASGVAAYNKASDDDDDDKKNTNYAYNYSPNSGTKPV